MAKGKSFKAMLKRMLKIEAAVSLLEERRSYVRQRTTGHTSQSCESSCSKEVENENRSGSEDFQMYDKAEQFDPWDTYVPWNTIDSEGEVSSVHINPAGQGVWDESLSMAEPSAPACGDCAYLESYVIDLEQAKLDLQVLVRELREGFHIETERADSCEEQEERYRNIIAEKEARFQGVSLELSRPNQQLHQFLEQTNEQSLEIRKLKDCIGDMVDEHEAAIFKVSEENNQLSDLLEESNKRLKWALDGDEGLARRGAQWYSN